MRGSSERAGKAGAPWAVALDVATAPYVAVAACYST